VWLGRQCRRALPLLAKAGTQSYKAFDEVLLVDERGDALRADALPDNEEFIFYYPLVSTPCFLLKLDETQGVDLQTAAGSEYRWSGGVGPGNRLVAYSAICAHKLSHPSPTVSFIGYRKDLPAVLNDSDGVPPQSGVIQCCSEHSVYDPARGAQVVSGPAPQPLAAIELNVAQDKIYATGVWGGDLFETFLSKFGMRVQLEMRVADVSAPVRGNTVVMRGDEFSRRRIRCG